MYSNLCTIIDRMLPLKKWFILQTIGNVRFNNARYVVMIVDYKHPTVDGKTKLYHEDVLFQTNDRVEAKDFILEFLYQLQDITDQAGVQAVSTIEVL